MVGVTIDVTWLLPRIIAELVSVMLCISVGLAKL